ncbi:M48 family metalloprotease [Streptomyces sp. LBUM 1484]|nr:M48 family metalloprotease [Streptomyces sp. LBUM 1484]
MLSSYPEETEDLDAALERLERQGRSRARPPVGMGVDMLPLADHLLPAVAALFGAVGGALAEQTATVLSEKTRAGLARLRGEPHHTFDPLAPSRRRRSAPRSSSCSRGRSPPRRPTRWGWPWSVRCACATAATVAMAAPVACVTETSLADARAAAVPARPAQLTSPTRGHYLLLMVVLAVAGITAGALIFNEVHGTAWGRAQLACAESVGPLPSDPREELRLQIENLSCAAPAERERAAAGLAGGAAVVALGLTLTWWLPRRLIRRIGPLTAPPPHWPSPGPPVRLGGPDLIEPFTVQHLGAPHIVMPRGARRLPAAEVAAALRHECAHVAAGDVRLAWLVRGLRRALPIVAVLPVLVTTVAALAEPDRSVLGSLFRWVWLDYVARVVLLAVAAWIIGARVGRAREHEADSVAAADGAGPGLTALLERAEAGPRRLRERLAGTHPTPRQRLTRLGNRTPPAVLGRLDELVAGVLAVTVLTTSYQVTTPAFTATPVGGWTLAIDALLAGALLAVACGPAWWHQPPPDARAPWWHRAGACLAVPSAVPVGLYIGVNRTGATGDGPYGSWWVLLTLSWRRPGRP